MYPNDLSACFKMVDQDQKWLASNMFSVVRASCLSWRWTQVVAPYMLPSRPIPVYSREGFSICSGKIQIYTKSSMFSSLSWLICTLMFLPFLVLISASACIWVEYFSVWSSLLEFFCVLHYITHFLSSFLAIRISVL